MSSKRLFTALRFPTQTIEQIAQVQEILKQKDERARYVNPIKNFHITLYFIGNVEEEKVNDMKRALDLACKEYRETINRPIVIKFNKVGSFRNGQVVWLGIEENEDLTTLSELIRKYVEEMGVTVKKAPYKPHITLARKFKGMIPQPNKLPESVTIDQASLVWSHRVNDVLTYDNLIFEDLTN